MNQVSEIGEYDLVSFALLLKVFSTIFIILATQKWHLYASLLLLSLITLATNIKTTMADDNRHLMNAVSTRDNFLYNYLFVFFFLLAASVKSLLSFVLGGRSEHISTNWIAAGSLIISSRLVRVAGFVGMLPVSSLQLHQ